MPTKTVPEHIKESILATPRHKSTDCFFLKRLAVKLFDKVTIFLAIPQGVFLEGLKAVRRRGLKNTKGLTWHSRTSDFPLKGVLLG